MICPLSRALLPPNQNLRCRPLKGTLIRSLAVKRSCDNDRNELRAEGVEQFCYISWKGWRTRMKLRFARASRLARTTAPGNK